MFDVPRPAMYNNHLYPFHIGNLVLATCPSNLEKAEKLL